jgi:uncharacterized protein
MALLGNPDYYEDARIMDIAEKNRLDYERRMAELIPPQDKDGVITEAEHRRLGITAPINYWIWTNSGKKFSYNYPHPDQICIEDIANSLSKICRYAGHCDLFYSVSDHCCNLVEYEESNGITNPIYLLGVLLHDAGEAYLSDIPAPAKKLLPDFKRMEKEIFAVIAAKFGIPNDEEFHRQLDYIDKNIVRDEAELLFKATPTWVKDYKRLCAYIVISESPELGRIRFLNLYYDLRRQIAEMDYEAR